VPLAFKLKN